MSPVPVDVAVVDNQEIIASETNARIGLLYRHLDGADIGLDLANLAASLVALLWRPGMICATARATADTDFLLCDGAAVSRSTYAALFTAIGTGYGTGNGTTTFNVPDLRGRVPVGVDGAAGRLSANDARANTGGEETHTLSTAELAAHVHPPLVLTNYVMQQAGQTQLDNGAGSLFNPAGIAATTGSAGGGGAHNNMQPYQIVNWQIRP